MHTCKITIRTLKNLFKNFLFPERFVMVGFTKNEIIFQNISKDNRFIQEVRGPVIESSFTDTFINLEVANLKGLLGTTSKEILFELLKPLPILEITLEESLKKYRILGYTKREFILERPIDYNSMIIDKELKLKNYLLALGYEFNWLNLSVEFEELEVIATNREFNSARMKVPLEGSFESRIYEQTRTQHYLKPIINFLKTLQENFELYITSSNDLFLFKVYGDITCSLVILNNL